MDRLIHAHLFGDGLIPIEGDTLVGRYRDALTELGIDPTTPQRFRIDGIGWSPEIADERGDHYYLGQGVPNQMGILLTPEQEGKPVYFPYRSFDRYMMIDYFEQFRPEIADITAHGRLTLDFDQGVSHYDSPRDLLLINSFVIHSSAGKLSTAAREQRDLTKRFLGEKEAWFDETLRVQLIASATEFGDLRERRIHVPDFRFTEVQDFYTRAFDGVFVIRSHEGKPILILEDHALAKSTRTTGIEVKLSGTEAMVECLRGAGLVEIDLDWYRTHPDELLRRLKGLMAEFLCTEEPDLDFAGMTHIRRRKELLARKAKAPAVIFQLEKFMKQLESGQVNDTADLSTDLSLVLLHPARRFERRLTRRVIWQALASVQPWDVLHQYIFCRNVFYALYKQWPPAKKEWAIKHINKRYVRKTERTRTS